MDGSKPICYYKSHIKNFINPNAKMEFVELTPDRALGKVTTDHKAGVVSFKLSVNDVAKNGKLDWSQYDAWKSPPSKKPKAKKVRAYIF